jgi:hypothetical protein
MTDTNTMSKRIYDFMHLYPFALAEAEPAAPLTDDERRRLGVDDVECRVFAHPSDPTMCFPFTAADHEYMGLVVRE